MGLNLRLPVCLSWCLRLFAIGEFFWISARVEMFEIKPGAAPGLDPALFAAVE